MLIRKRVLSYINTQESATAQLGVIVIQPQKKDHLSNVVFISLCVEITRPKIKYRDNLFSQTFSFIFFELPFSEVNFLTTLL